MSAGQFRPGRASVGSSQDADQDFMLSKWYLDCVSQEGEACIGYAATLRWKGFDLHYSSILVHSRLAPVWTRTSLREISTPEITGGDIRWCCTPLKVEGHWTALSQPIERDLMKTRNGMLQWRCCQPHARSSICLDGSHQIQGFGYVEKIELSIPPWELNIDTLRWGRFLSESHALVWIAYDGCGDSKAHVFFNGNEIDDCSVADTGVTLDHGRISLALQESRVLREGPLVSTALSMIPGITRLLPGKILQTHERKWLSKGGLATTGAPPHEGWAIHEVVNFT